MKDSKNGTTPKDNGIAVLARDWQIYKPKKHGNKKKQQNKTKCRSKKQ